MTYRTCPRCGEEKCFRLVGSYEWDTNAGEELDVDEKYSCKCDLTADEWLELTDTISTEDFIEDYG